LASAFISYARRDLAFARYLTEALTDRDGEVWVDWHDISPGEEWAERIREAIEAADAFIPILTPDWLASSVCQTQFVQADELGKRLIPVLRRELDEGGAALPKSLQSLSWVSFLEQDDSEAALTSLHQAISTDPAWVREHTRVLQRASEWQRNLRDEAYLLRGDALERAEAWLAEAAQQVPRPTHLQVEYIVASRKASKGVRKRTQRGVFISYRRDETIAYAGRLHDQLSALLGSKNVFVDLDRIRPGGDFVVALGEALDASGVLLALIGNQWLELREPDGSRRLENPGDFVRLELENALSRGITVIPVLVDGAKAPPPDQLPESLSELPRLHAVQLSHEQWRRDFEGLVSALPPEVREGGGLFRALRRRSRV
jgi:TIR domain